MRLLLDTHAFLRWLADDPLLPAQTRTVIADARTIVHVSAASLWEISLKHALGRLEIDGADLVAEIPANGFVELPVTAEHAWLAASLPPHHDEPFDRLLIAQARLEGLTLATGNLKAAQYGVQILPIPPPA